MCGLLHPGSCWTLSEAHSSTGPALLAGNTSLLVHCVLVTLATDAPFFQMTLLQMALLPSPIHWPWKGWARSDARAGRSLNYSSSEVHGTRPGTTGIQNMSEWPQWPRHVAEGLPLQTVSCHHSWSAPHLTEFPQIPSPVWTCPCPRKGAPCLCQG